MSAGCPPISTVLLPGDQGDNITGIHGIGVTLYNILGEVLYTGGFSNGVYDGTGELSSAGLIYSGQFKEGLLSGEGTLSQDNNLIYKGGFQKNLFNGSGILYPCP